VAFSLDWIRQLPGQPLPEALCLFVVEDDSMHPTLKQGDLVLANVFADKAREGIYLIVLTPGVHARNAIIGVRRVGRLPDGSMRAVRDNPQYAALDAANPASLDPNLIYARVIWWGGLL
jgi:phage repressor protein C with HTH and peptisase S24 domain